MHACMGSGWLLGRVHAAVHLCIGAGAADVLHHHANALLGFRHKKGTHCEQQAHERHAGGRALPPGPPDPLLLWPIRLIRLPVQQPPAVVAAAAAAACSAAGVEAAAVLPAPIRQSAAGHARVVGAIAAMLGCSCAAGDPVATMAAVRLRTPVRAATRADAVCIAGSGFNVSV